MPNCHQLLRVIILAALPVFSLSAGQDPQRGVKVVSASKAGQRIALVIGNSGYGEAPLKNPVNDARAIAKALRNCGFQVIEGENLTREQMLRAIEDFRRQIQSGGTALFYFAGHGMQVKGENYLIPVGARIQGELDVEIEGVHLVRVLNEMSEARSGVNLVILDACRNNPFARSFRSGANGLSVVSAPSGTLIAYATAPQNTASDGAGANGLYTQELLAAIRTPGLLVEQVFKRVRQMVEAKSGGAQTPWENSSLKGDFYFIQGNAPTPEAPPVLTPANADTPSDANPVNSSNEPVTTAFRSIEGPWPIYVPAEAAWKSTDLLLKPGQQVELQAGGSILLDRTSRTEAAGLPRFDDKNPMPSCQLGALLARIGNGPPVCIRAKGTLDVIQSGQLELGINDRTFQDNQGGYNVTVTVRSALKRN